MAVSVNKKTESSVTFAITMTKKRDFWSQTTLYVKIYNLSDAYQYAYASAAVFPKNTVGTKYYTISGLLPNTTYRVIAKSKKSNGSTWDTQKTFSFTTAAAAGNLSAKTVAFNDVTLQLSGLSTAVGYTRSAAFYYKRTADSTWLSGGNATGIPASGAMDIEKQIQGLVSGETYDFKLILSTSNNKWNKYKATTIYTKTITGITTKSSLENIPKPQITDIKHRYYDRTMRIYWTADNLKPGAYYKIFRGNTEVASPTEIPTSGYTDVPAGDADTLYTYSIRAYTTSTLTTLYNESNKINETAVYTFRWTYPKTAGSPAKVSAEEWNYCLEWIRQYRVKNSLAEISLPEKLPGDDITNEDYNAAKDAIGITDPPDRNDGSKITAACYTAIANKLNS